jgi:hypothetical protein
MVTVFVQNATSTTGAGLTGLTYNASGLEWYWFAEDSGTSTSISLTNMTLGTWTSGGFVQVDSTNLPGFYEIGIPNTVIANTNSRTWVTMLLQGAANMVPIPIEIQLVEYNPMDGVSLGLTGVKSNVVAWSNTSVPPPDVGGVPIVDLLYWRGATPNGLTFGNLPSGPVLVSGTATGGGSNTLLVAGITTNTQAYQGGLLTVISGLFAQSRLITGYTGGGTCTFTVAPNWQANPASGYDFVVTPWGGVDVEMWQNSTSLPVSSTNVNVTEWLGTAVTSNAGIPVVYTTNTVAATVAGTVTATVPTEVLANVTEWLGTAVTSNAGVPVVYTTNTVTSVVASGTVTTVTGNVGGSVASVVGTVTATVPTLSTNVNVTKLDGTNISLDPAGNLFVDVASWAGANAASVGGLPIVYTSNTVTATVIGGTIATVSGNVVGTVGSVTAPVTIATGQLTIKRNTALSGFTFPMYNGTGGPQTGLTVSGEVSIDGAAIVNTVNSPTEVGQGVYSLNLSPADVNGTVITFIFTASGASTTIITVITQA